MALAPSVSVSRSAQAVSPALDVLRVVRGQYSPRVLAILQIVLEESQSIDAIQTGSVAFHFAVEGHVKPKLHNEMQIIFDGNLAARST